MFKKAMAILLCTTILCGCTAPAQQKTENEGLSVVTTVFPVYDWLRNITEGTDTEVTMLMQNGSDLHNFQPSAKDIITINDADMFVYIGGESDEWTADVLREAKSSLESVSLMDSGRVSLVEDEVKEGMTVEEEEEPENDEHIWLSLQNAIKYTELLSEKLQEIDPDNAERYHQNAEAYIGKLMALDREYSVTAENAKNRTLVFCDRFPFIYMMKDYGLDYYAAFNGCSAETEASFETVVYLGEKLDELQLKHVFIIENSNTDIADTVIRTSKDQNRDILVLDSMQSVTGGQAENGVTYLSVMEENLEVLKKGLN